MRNLDLLGGAEILSESECWDVLANETVGRLAVVSKGRPDIFPVNFGCDERAIVIYSNMGHKLLSASGAVVAFEVDRADPRSKMAYSVVLHGPATVEPGDEEGFAWSGPKDFQIRIDPLEVTGRRVSFRPHV